MSRPPLYFIEGDGSGPRLTELITPFTFKRLRGAGELAIGPAVGGPAARTFKSTTKPTAQVLVHQAKQHSAHTETFPTRTQTRTSAHEQAERSHSALFSIAARPPVK